jgi:hypothetical protein
MRPPSSIGSQIVIWILIISGFVAVGVGSALIYSARHGNLERDPQEVRWYKERKEEQMIAEGFSKEEAARHAYTFGYLYTLADDTEFSKRRFTFAYVFLSISVLCALSASALSFKKQTNEPNK